METSLTTNNDKTNKRGKHVSAAEHVCKQSKQLSRCIHILILNKAQNKTPWPLPSRRHLPLPHKDLCQATRKLWSKPSPAACNATSFAIAAYFQPCTHGGAGSRPCTHGALFKRTTRDCCIVQQNEAGLVSSTLRPRSSTEWSVERGNQRHDECFKFCKQILIIFAP